MEATPVEINQGIAARVRAVRKQGEQQKKLILIQVARTCRVSAFFIWRKGRMYEFDILVAVTAKEGFGNLGEGNIA